MSAWLCTRLSKVSARWGCRASNFLSQKFGIRSIPGVLKFPNWVSFLLTISESNRIPIILMLFRCFIQGSPELFQLFFLWWIFNLYCVTNQFPVDFPGVFCKESVDSFLIDFLVFISNLGCQSLDVWLMFSNFGTNLMVFNFLLSLRRPTFKAKCFVVGPDELITESFAISFLIFFCRLIFQGASFFMFEPYFLGHFSSKSGTSCLWIYRAAPFTYLSDPAKPHQSVYGLVQSQKCQ